MTTRNPHSRTRPTTPPWRRIGRTAALGAASTAALFALAACGGGNPAGAPQVAALPSGSTASGSGQSASVPTTPPTAGRPQERLDDTPQQRLALIHAWDVCLLANGATTQGAVGVAPSAGQAGADRTDTLAEPIPKKAIDACADKEPLGAPELDPSKNPNYRADTQAEIACLRAHGEMVHLTQDTSVYPDGLSWTFDDNAPSLPANESQIEDTCQQTAFADKRGGGGPPSGGR